MTAAAENDRCWLAGGQGWHGQLDQPRRPAPMRAPSFSKPGAWRDRPRRCRATRATPASDADCASARRRQCVARSCHAPPARRLRTSDAARPTFDIADATAAQFRVTRVAAHAGLVVPAAHALGLGRGLRTDENVVGTGRGHGDVATDEQEAQFLGQRLPARSGLRIGGHGDFRFQRRTDRAIGASAPAPWPPARAGPATCRNPHRSTQRRPATAQGRRTRWRRARCRHACPAGSPTVPRQ